MKRLGNPRGDIAAMEVPSRPLRDVECMGVITLIFVACNFSTRFRRPAKGGLDVHMYASEKPSALAGGFREIRPALLAAGGLSVFINLLVFVSPLYTMQVYDRVLTSRNGMTLLLLSLIALALFVSYAVLEHFRSRVLVQTGLRFDELVSGEAFETALARRCVRAARIMFSSCAMSIRYAMFSPGA